MMNSLNSLFDIEGKIALVTGGVNGLGRMISEGLLRAGAKVYVTTRKRQAAEEAHTQLSTIGNCVVLTADLNTAQGAVELATRIRQLEPKLHVLINNAGKTWGAPLDSFPDSAWEGVITVNLQGPFTLVREFLPLLIAGASEEDPSRVINIGSLAGRVVEPISAYSYAASKAAIHHLSRVLAAELAPRHLTVNAIVPGYFPTHMTAPIRKNEAEMKALLDRVPLGRLGEADDIVGMCIFLASRAGRYVTGAELCVDGGMAGCR
jgi:NAD(P)-dependent dehydrogenase (short-subunit alcohol dehydrogenase family)